MVKRLQLTLINYIITLSMPNKLPGIKVYFLAKKHKKMF